MKRFLLLFCLLLTNNSFSQRLHNFSQIKSAVISGKPIHIVIILSKCLPSKISDSIEIFEAISISPTEIAIHNNDITASFSHFMMNVFPKEKAVYNIHKLTITINNNVDLVTQNVDAVSYKILKQTYFQCKLDTLAKVYD